MRVLKTIPFLLLLAAAFFGGYIYRSSSRSPSPANPVANGRRILYWVDPMHPAYKSDKPGIAPDCGMKLVPVYADGGSAGPASGAHGNEPSTFLPGTIQITPEKQQLIGVKYGTAEVTGATETIRAAGKVTYDETRIAHVHTKYEGWIDKVYVDFIGQLVEKGQPLLTIYSPELLSSEQELLLARTAKDVMKKSSLPGAIDQSESLFEAARRRLELWDISEAQIDRVLATGRPIKNVTLYSPISGYVLDRKAFPQVKVMPETDLYTVADLSRVWIMADVFEYEAPKIRVGEAARVEMSYEPGKSFGARVAYIQPEVDPMTRTLKVRLEADNPGVGLKPDMYVDVKFRVDSAASLTVPAEAVLNAGDRKTVFVDRGNGYFEPRAVETGDQTGGRVTILSGLKAGERIVTSGNFLIDSESQLKAAASGMEPAPAAGARKNHD
jgi:Cu(I)/Ag(I) efflux system membrane fusion protein